MTTPYIKLFKVQENLEYPIVKPAGAKREFFDQTQDSHMYHCQPLTTATLHGWEFICPHDVEVIWDGVSDVSSTHIQVLKGRTHSDGSNFVDTHTGNSMLTFDLNVLLETDKDHYLLLQGPANHHVDGATPMSVILRSDWYKSTSLQYSWRLTKANTPIIFKAGTPILTIINYPIGLLESTDISIENSTPEQRDFLKRYMDIRSDFYKKNPGKWTHMYKNSTTSLDPDAERHLDSVFRPSPKTPRIIKPE